MTHYRSILVLCEGNHCRSPIAQGLLQHALGDKYRVESAGLAAAEGVPVHEEAKRLMALHGIDISSITSRQLTPEMALSADLILVMDRAQMSRCQALAPSTRGRVFLLGHWQKPAPIEIVDPFKQNTEVFSLVFEAIQQCVAGWIPHLTFKKRSA